MKSLVKITMFVAAVSVFLHPVLPGEPTEIQQSPELKVLQRFIGSWEQQVVSKPAQWTPQKQTMGLTTKCEWILGGRMLQSKGEWSPGGIETLILMTYDAEKKVYRQWYFDSKGIIPRGEELGKWDEATKTLTWTGRLGNGITKTGVTRFIDKDTNEWTVVFKDSDGKVLLDMEGKAKRK